ncbi:MAG: M24 family metallopeptidase, partial [Thermomicrobiales bacterium]
MPPTIKNTREIAKMREAGAVVALIHQRISAAVSPGVTTMDLDTIARDTMAEVGAVSSFLGYHGFPGHICASVNDEIVHGIPGKRILRDGDIIAVDVGAILDGWHGDSAWT